ncbi:hypothetical protein DB32_000598 [Sandaracinus amylolyticus]|uniref:Uncharacterized protein n=1 Tax=Sandaracinus amylolyticus TaxID=927083 RepID=A0A0F6SDH4_9BACT|nr:hypothetical protein DB32_000598 [Sandaracinus amylolyticus]
MIARASQRWAPRAMPSASFIGAGEYQRSPRHRARLGALSRALERWTAEPIPS